MAIKISKHFANLCSLSAEWHFFATGHRKSLHDIVEVTVNSFNTKLATAGQKYFGSKDQLGQEYPHKYH